MQDTEKKIQIPLEQQADIAIILPAYNECLTVQATILDFHTALPKARIYIIDNNSSDDTYNIAINTLQEHSINGAVIQEKRQGKGNAIRRAFLDIDAKVYLMADADCTYPAIHAAELVLPILNEEADMVIGDRQSQGDYARENTRPLHNFGNKLVLKLVNMVGNSNFSDIMTGYRALSQSFVRSYPLLVEGFQIETDISLFATQARFRCLEIPIRYVDRPAGSFSKLSTIKDGMRVLLTIFRIIRFYKPLSFFMSLSTFFAILGIAFGLPVIYEYMEFQYIYKLPMAVLAASLELLAATFLSAGLNLDAQAYQRRMDIEQNIQKHTKARYYK